MKQKFAVLVIALLMVGGFATTAFALTTDGDSDARAEHSKAEKADHPGPPSWAHAHQNSKVGKGARADKQAWKAYWRGLTPTQRAETMANLAQKHADGMKKWAACVKAAGTDKTARAACERPLPPGLAKKHLR